MSQKQLIVHLGLDAAEFNAGLKAAKMQLVSVGTTSTASMATVGQAFKNAGWSMRRVGIDMTKYILLPMVAIGAASFNLYKGFESSMQKIVGLVGVAQSEVDGFSETILDLAVETAKAPKELAEAMYFITSAGVRGAEALDILEMSAKAAASGLGETKVIASLVVSAVNAYGKANLTAAEATDTLVVAVREGQAEAANFASSLGRVLPMAAELGVEFYQVAGALAAMTRTGSTAEEATTQLRQVIFSLLKPSQQAEDAIKGMRTSFGALRQTLAEEGLMPVLSEIRALTAAYGEEMVAEVFPNIRALAGVLDLTGKNMKETMEIMERMKNVTGYTGEAFGVASRTADFQWKLSIINVIIELIKLGEAMKSPLLNLINKLSASIKEAISHFLSLSDSQQKNRINMLAYAAGLGMAMTAISILIVTIGNLIMVFGKLSSFLVLNPWTAWIAAVAAAAFVVYKLVKAVKEVNNVQTKLEEANKRMTDSYADQVGSIDSLVWAIENENLSLGHRKKAILDLQKIIPNYVASIDDEGKLYVKTKEAIDLYISSLKDRLRVEMQAAEVKSGLQEQIKLENELMGLQNKMEVNQKAWEDKKAELTKKNGIISQWHMNELTHSYAKLMTKDQKRAKQVKKELEEVGILIDVYKTRLEEAPSSNLFTVPTEAEAKLLHIADLKNSIAKMESYNLENFTKQQLESHNKLLAQFKEQLFYSLGGQEKLTSEIQQLKLDIAKEEEAIEVEMDIIKRDNHIRELGRLQDELSRIMSIYDAEKAAIKEQQDFAEKYGTGRLAQLQRELIALQKIKKAAKTDEEVKAADRDVGAKEEEIKTLNTTYDTELAEKEKIIKAQEAFDKKYGVGYLAGLQKLLLEAQQMKRDAANEAEAQAADEAEMEVQIKIDAFNKYAENKIKAAKKLADEERKIQKQLLADQKAILDAWKNATARAIEDAIFGLSEAIGSSLMGGDIDKGMLDYITKLGNFLKQVGAMFIAFGVAKLKFIAALAGGPITAGELIAAGITLVITGAAITTTSKNAIKDLAGGGIAYGETLVNVGEYPGARSNPEVIAPLSALNSILGNRNENGGNFKFEIDGYTLVAMMQKMNNKNSIS